MRSNEQPDLVFEILDWGAPFRGARQRLHWQDLPNVPGSYLLRLELSSPLHLEVGRLGSFDFPSGLYLYGGSAHGPGGLKARLTHHIRLSAHPHWNLDFLRPHLLLTGGWVVCEWGEARTLPLECHWSQSAVRFGRASLPASGFGSADCRCACPAHLVRLPGGTDWDPFEHVPGQCQF